jgi:hypothetical protein
MELCEIDSWQPSSARPAIPATGGRWIPSSEHWMRNFQHMPTSMPGIGPKWLFGTMVLESI